MQSRTSVWPSTSWRSDSIWERDGERTLEVDHSCGDYPRWIDTSVMLADPLTKAMGSEVLVGTMMTGRYDMRPTAESLMIKAKNRACRKRTKNVGESSSPTVTVPTYD